jgi:mannose-1-phosphate guanylyltransferase
MADVVKDVHVVVLVGGPSTGTRFRPISVQFPKPLLPVAGRPMIWHIVRQAAQCPRVRTVFLLGFYDEDGAWKAFASAAAAELRVGVDYLAEGGELGTAGGLHRFRDVLLKDAPAGVFVVNGDVCCSFPFSDMLARFEAARAAAAAPPLGMLLTTTIAPEAESVHYGCLVEEPAAAGDSVPPRIVHYVEKPRTVVSPLINGGVYFLRPEVWDSIAEATRRRCADAAVRDGGMRRSESMSLFQRSLQRHRRAHLERDVFMPLVERRALLAYRARGPWAQAKKPGDLLRCAEIYLASGAAGPVGPAPPAPNVRGAVYIDPSASVHPSALVGPNVCIGPGVVVHAGARVSHALLLDSCVVHDHAVVAYAVVGFSSHVGPWARVEGAPDTASPEFYSHGKPQGCAVLGEQCDVQPEVMLYCCIVMPHKDVAESAHHEIII